MIRIQQVIYAVVLREHPTIVKIGRTTNWLRRRSSYDNWNFALGDGISNLAVYCVTDEYVDLAGLESACLGAMNKPLVRGFEWFRADLDHARKAIESILIASQISFVEFDFNDPKVTKFKRPA